MRVGSSILNFCASLLFLLVAAAAPAASDIAAIVMHGKWGSPDRQVNAVANALQREGYAVVSPEMPWSRGRLYDRTVEEADSAMDAEIARLRAGGARRIFLVGHSLGAAYALHYASRNEVSGVIAIAPGHRPENRRFAESFGSEVRKARELVAAGRPDELISFTDLNTGNRRDRLTARAVSFASYFDPEGPMNMTRNVAGVKPGTPVLWIVPTREEPGPREGGLQLYRRLPPHPATRLVEPESDHLNAPAASAAAIVEWIRAVTKP